MVDKGFNIAYRILGKFMGLGESHAHLVLAALLTVLLTRNQLTYLLSFPP